MASSSNLKLLLLQCHRACLTTWRKPWRRWTEKKRATCTPGILWKRIWEVSVCQRVSCRETGPVCNSLLTSLNFGSFPACVGVQPDTFQTCSLFSLNGRSCWISWRYCGIFCPTSSIAAASIALVSKVSNWYKSSHSCRRRSATWASVKFHRSFNLKNSR